MASEGPPAAAAKPSRGRVILKMSVQLVCAQHQPCLAAHPDSALLTGVLSLPRARSPMGRKASSTSSQAPTRVSWRSNSARSTTCKTRRYVCTHLSSHGEHRIGADSPLIARVSPMQLRRVVERHIAENMRALPSPGAAPAEASRAASTGSLDSHGEGAAASSSGADNGGRSSSGSKSRVPFARTSTSGGPLPPLPVGDSSRSEDGMSSVHAALGRVRLQAATWRSAARDAELVRRCWGALVDLHWRGRMRQYHEAAHAEATAARSAEIAELHAANVRIAQLAFAQAGKTADEASAELREILKPPPPAGAAERLREQLNRLLERDRRRSDEAVKARAWAALRDGSSRRGGASSSARGGGSEETKLAAANAKVDKLTRLVEDLTGEVEELTADLIAAKLSQAELANAGLTLSHQKRQLEKQLIVESVEVRVPPRCRRCARPRYPLPTLSHCAWAMNDSLTLPCAADT